MAATAGTCRQIKKDGFVCGQPASSGDCATENGCNSRNMPSDQEGRLCVWTACLLGRLRHREWLQQPEHAVRSRRTALCVDSLPPRATAPPRMAATAGTCRQIKKDGFVCGLPASSGDCATENGCNSRNMPSDQEGRLCVWTAC